eukprot:GHVR01082824.1.p1 GENE.GHVR01082824.1~~GHVR01082824.1.p1  ORF type:complete len:117 (-),score=5.14 GHVR01082824.1:205-555(-)
MDKSLLKLFLYFQVLCLLMDSIVSSVVLLYPNKKHIIKFLNSVNYHERAVTHTHEGAHNLHTLMIITTLIVFATELYFIFITKALIKVLESGGTGNEFKSAEELKDTRSDPLLVHV